MATAYYYRVTAVDGEGEESDLSTEVRVTAGSGARFVWPVEAPCVSQDYATFDSGVAGSHHLGIDLISAHGSRDILAAADGEVELEGSSPQGEGYGRYVVIDHDGNNLYSLYAHLDPGEEVADGEVKQGEPIGTMGESGYATGRHLHFDVVALSSAPVDVEEAFNDGYHPEHPATIDHPDPKVFLAQRTVRVNKGSVKVRKKPCNDDCNEDNILTTIEQGQEFVNVGPPVDGWHFIYLPYKVFPYPNDDYFDYDRYGWVNGQALTVVEPGPKQIRIDGQKLASEGGEYLRVRGGPDTSEVILNKVWDGQRFVTIGSAQEGPGSTQPWYKIHLSENAGASEGWVAGDFVSVVLPQASGILAAATRLVNTDGDVYLLGNRRRRQRNG